MLEGLDVEAYQGRGPEHAGEREVGNRQRARDVRLGLERRVEHATVRGEVRGGACIACGVDRAKRQRFDEALDFIIGAWTQEAFSFEGKYFHAKELSVVQRPLKQPHPPIRIAANSPDTFPFAARR